MRIELHLLQSFAPSNLNRDDTGAPKDATFGGSRRARISSQAIKRAIRKQFPACGLGDDDLGVRTRLIVDETVARLVVRGHDDKESRAVVGAALGSLGLGVTKEGTTEYLLFTGRRAIDALAEECDKHFKTLLVASEAGPTKKAKKGKTEEGGIALDVDVLDATHAADVALFGRMIADLPDRNVDAASQVAHAISTHVSQVEFDYFTAVDDLQPAAESGAGMIGTIEYNAACYYRYQNLDIDQLATNLDGDTDLVTRATHAWLQGSIDAIPTGKQNTFAAQSPPSLILAVVRNHQLWSLANAFLQPARADHETDVLTNSARALARQYLDLIDMYGGDDIVTVGYSAVGALDMPGFTSQQRHQPISALIDHVITKVS